MRQGTILRALLLLLALLAAPSHAATITQPTTLSGDCTGSGIGAVVTSCVRTEEFIGNNDGSWVANSTTDTPISGFTFAVNLGTSHAPQIVAASGTFKNLYMSVRIAPTSTNTDTITLWVNGSPTSVTCTITGSATSCSDTVDTAAITAGQTVYYVVTVSASATAPGDVYYAIQKTTP